jgi:hypothetical protein
MQKNQHENMIRGRRQPGESNVVALYGKEKQFSAVLVGADPGDEAVINIFACPDNSKDRRIPVATLHVSADEPADVTPIIESLIGPHYAEVESISSGEVWVYGDC